MTITPGYPKRDLIRRYLTEDIHVTSFCEVQEAETNNTAHKKSDATQVTRQQETRREKYDKETEVRQRGIQDNSHTLRILNVGSVTADIQDLQIHGKEVKNQPTRGRKPIKSEKLSGHKSERTWRSTEGSKTEDNCTTQRNRMQLTDNKKPQMNIKDSLHEE